MKLPNQQHRYLYILAISMLLLTGLSGCFEKYSNSNKTKDCSVYKRCEGLPDLGIRLRQVETYYYEDATIDTVSFTDIAQFYYNDLGQWTGGITRRSTQSDFDYTIDYDVNGYISATNRTYYDDEGNTADVSITYNYNLGLLDQSQSSTSIYDSNAQLLKTIDETISYAYVSGDVADITFSGNDSVDGTYLFHYELTYSGNLITRIDKTQQSNSDPDFIFKSYQYDGDGRVSSSKTFVLDSGGTQVERENITYEYYLDGPLKLKTSLLNTYPQQKIITRYSWEEGGCAINQIFGDRLYPTPEVPDFPCY